MSRGQDVSDCLNMTDGHYIFLLLVPFKIAQVVSTLGVISGEAPLWLTSYTGHPPILG